MCCETHEAWDWESRNAHSNPGFDAELLADLVQSIYEAKRVSPAKRGHSQQVSGVDK